MGLFTEPKARIKSILDGSVDTSGCTAHTQSLALSAGYLTAMEYTGLLESPQIPAESFHRRFQVFINDNEDQNQEAVLNEHNGGRQLQAFKLAVRIGYLWGISTTIGWGSPQGSETVDTQQSPESAYEAAQADAVRIKRLLTITELLQVTPVTDPVIVSCRQVGVASTVEVHPNRLITQIDFRLLLDLNLSQVYGP